MNGGLKVVPKKPIDVALEILAANGYKPTGGSVGDISEWKLPGSDTSLGIKQVEGTKVAVIMDFASKKPAYLEGKTLIPSFVVTNMDDVMRFAKDFVKHAQARGIPLPQEEVAAKKQKVGPG